MLLASITICLTLPQVKKLSNIQLTVILVLLLAGVGAVKLYDRTAIDWNFKSKYTYVDATKVDTILAADKTTDTLWLVNDNPANWQVVSYKLPDKASFTVARTGDGWVAGDSITYPPKTNKFLGELQQVYGTTLIEGVQPAAFQRPEYSLKLVDMNNDTVMVNCYVRAGFLLMTSTLAPGYVFDGRADSLFEQVYVGRRRFFKNPEDTI